MVNALQEFASAFEWRSDGSDSALDAGCGPGDITSDILSPFLPSNYKRLVGVDISKEMIGYARETVANPKLSFEEFDLSRNLEDQKFANSEPFDHLFSFYTLMWVSDQKTCMRNFNKLLRPGGNMLLIFLGNHPVYDVYQEQSKNIKWAEYMTDVNQLISPYHSSEDPAKQLQTLLSECGFGKADIRIHNKTYHHTYESMSSIMISVNPFVDRIPAEHRQTYVDDFIQLFAKKCLVDETVMDIDRSRFVLRYQLIVAHAKKKYNFEMITDRGMTHFSVKKSFGSTDCSLFELNSQLCDNLGDIIYALRARAMHLFIPQMSVVVFDYSQLSGDWPTHTIKTTTVAHHFNKKQSCK
ncbi:Juvenile hormone acid O-methyltransferase [Pseudolycoriella hygida]|uniref:Juvenile hormone acid O-methyltransferase n=1 Tax=Pseudolycoriella hygida TaxID=35572 RepID=A0A9Q0N7Z1_9DIPT|nr:Juvenile hormone acid O-methyltransferase [Pseudolycoriella hygida]